MAETMGTGGHIALVLFEKEYTDIPSHVKHNKHKASVMHEGEKDFGLVISRFVGRDLQEGWFKPQRHEVVPGGLNGVITAFERLKSGEAHAMKYVIKPWRLKDSFPLSQGSTPTIIILCHQTIPYTNIHIETRFILQADFVTNKSNFEVPMDLIGAVSKTSV